MKWRDCKNGVTGALTVNVMCREAVMRIFIMSIGIMVMAAAAFADTFEWTDSQGGIHFTDNIDKVPAKYRDKAQKVDIQPIIQGEEKTAPTPATPAIQNLYGGHDEGWWRSRFSALRNEMKTIQDGLPAKREQFTNQHRRYIIFNKPQDRLAQNDLNDDIKKDEARIEEIRKQLDELDIEASKAGVPLEWRQ